MPAVSRRRRDGVSLVKNHVSNDLVKTEIPKTAKGKAASGQSLAPESPTARVTGAGPVDVAA